LIFGSISPSPPAPSPIIEQERAPVPTPQPPPPPDAWTQDALAILKDIPGMLISDAAITNYIADLLLLGKESILWKLFQGSLRGLLASAFFVDSIIEKLSSMLTKRTTAGILRPNFAKMAMRARARLGMAWGKQSAKIGESVAARTTAEMGSAGVDVASMARQIARGAGVAASTASSLTVGAARTSLQMATAIATDPLAVAGITGMILDSQNVGNFAELSTTSDLNSERDNQLNELKNTTIDCTSYPVGASCLSPGPPTSTPGPAPPSRAGRFPRFLGPHDLLDDEIFQANIIQIQNIVANPADSDGFKETVVMLETLAAQPGNSALSTEADSLRKLLNSILTRDAGGTNSRVLIPFIWASQSSQTVVSHAISVLNSYTSADAIMINARLKVHFEIQQITSNFIASSMNAYISKPTTSDLLRLIDGIVKSTALDSFITALFDRDCVDRGGVIFNPGNGYDPHTCTWATKEDCHGAYPWLSQDGQITDEITPNAMRAMCTSTCTVPSPCPPSPAPSPGACTKKIECPAPSPCQALVDPSKTDLLYTEWRDKNWFTNHSSLVSPLDTTAIPVQGACINGTLGYHMFCDNIQRVGMCGDDNPMANNIYIRDQGTCVNSKHLCDIKGVGFSGGSPPGVNITPSDTCVVSNRAAIVSGYLVGDTITRFYNSDSEVCVSFNPIPHVDTGDSTMNTIVNGGIDVLNTVATGLTDFAGDVATGLLDLAGSVGAAAGAIAAEGPVDFSPLVADPSQGSSQLNANLAGLLTGDSLNQQTAYYDGPGEIPETYWDGGCNYPFGCLRQRCPSNKVMINSGAGNYCYNRCRDGKSRGIALLTVDYCDFKGVCDSALGCACPPGQVNGGPNDIDSQTGCGCSADYYKDVSGTCVYSIMDDPDDSNYKIYKNHALSHAEIMTWAYKPANVGDISALRRECKYNCDCVAFDSAYLYRQDPNDSTPITAGGADIGRDVRLMKPGARASINCDWEADNCNSALVCRSDQYILGDCIREHGSDTRSCEDCPDGYICDGTTKTFDLQASCRTMRPADYNIPSPIYNGYKQQFIFIPSGDCYLDAHPTDTSSYTWNGYVLSYIGQTIFNVATQTMDVQFYDVNMDIVDWQYWGGPNSRGQFYRCVSILYTSANILSGIQGWFWVVCLSNTSHYSGAAASQRTTRADATIGVITPPPPQSPPPPTPPPPASSATCPLTCQSADMALAKSWYDTTGFLGAYIMTPLSGNLVDSTTCDIKYNYVSNPTWYWVNGPESGTDYQRFTYSSGTDCNKTVTASGGYHSGTTAA
jgi:hypothetical protein